jgi:4-hydroxy-4-methyl-2-oxoglutarate aldolase
MKDKENLTDRIGQLYTGAVHDVMRAKGLKDFVLPPDIRPLDASTRAFGPIFTIEGKMADISAHDSLLRWTEFLSRAPADHVVICQPNNQEVALMGELSAETLQGKGVRGFIVDGGCRDTSFILKSKFPVFHSFFTPKDVVGRWIPTNFESAIRIGDVKINPSDFVLADLDGVVIIPGDAANEIISATEAVSSTENKVRKAILGGMDPTEAYKIFGKF